MTKRQIIALYNKGIGTTIIAKLASRHRTSIQRLLKRANIILRKTSPRHRHDVSFFSNYTPKSCYWAGFILADGCIRSDCATVSIHLQKGDEQHLMKFKDAIKYTGPIRIDTYNDSRVIDVCGSWFVTQLNNQFGITPRKSLVTKFPYFIPEKYWHHFIRGILDGDGCITYTTTFTINFTGTKELLTALSDIFHNKVNVRLRYSRNKVPPFQTTSTSGIGQISYSGQNAIRILKWLYNGSTEQTRLTRKRDRYLFFLNCQKLLKI